MRTGLHATEPKGKEPRRIAPEVEQVEERRSQIATGSRRIHHEARRSTTPERARASPPFTSSQSRQADAIHDQRSQDAEPETRLRRTRPEPRRESAECA